MAQQGRIVVNGDEWTLSDEGFGFVPEVVHFAKNLATWLTDGRPGKFHAYSTNFGLTGQALARTLRDAGHRFSVGTQIPFTLESLRQYDVIMLAGNAADNDVLTRYVRAGGCVYLAGGTGWGGASREARRWKSFLNAFGLKFNARYDGIAARVEPHVDHPLFEGVGALLYYNGNDIVDIDPDAPENAVLLTHGGMGLIAAFDMGLTTPEVTIAVINYDGEVARTESDEYVELLNQGHAPTDISGWKISADDRGQDFVFPAGTVLEAGQSIRVYTDESHPEHGGFSYGIKRSIWNNRGDVGRLFDATGKEVSRFSYGDKKRTIPDVLKARGVPHCTVEATSRGAQEKLGGSVGFLDALDEALRSLIEDPAGGERYNAADALRDNDESVPADADAATIQGIIRGYVDEQTLQLLDADSLGDASESLDSTWIFRLRPGMGDTHYVYVDRRGARPTYQEIS